MEHSNQNSEVESPLSFSEPLKSILERLKMKHGGYRRNELIMICAHNVSISVERALKTQPNVLFLNLEGNQHIAMGERELERRLAMDSMIYLKEAKSLEAPSLILEQPKKRGDGFHKSKLNKPAVELSPLLGRLLEPHLN